MIHREVCRQVHFQLLTGSGKELFLEPSITMKGERHSKQISLEAIHTCGFRSDGQAKPFYAMFMIYEPFRRCGVLNGNNCQWKYTNPQGTL